MDLPADDLAAPDVDNHVGIEKDARNTGLKIGDIPTPDLVGTGGNEFGRPSAIPGSLRLAAVMQ